ncbi:putative Mitotic checkpoint regulator, MAD2B-interacting [Monocercomonoides exilis]|uniref:putative Mitotic checkpoint regulator, MAD2B-interacting n=1 Tax=Monocercomonoides exilis TaxID=2049356 RepID=UPI00355A454C|nr:putative Mitotic checkpoint regulator, MAD2B-interacting [Monocercomonoides exilis]|eukprot:MONOS_6318.1-p1 / transcript=MONOS_6318.1 / gene=MONOS_6318 / organism=Monocercomonoides_exilis_PA203 / gene_product=unspecified product / transcript_product=unspecified product / location=Mono_scaffold00197:56776-57573(-) / protein_length=214 / sequence_SO=supercontig / SO=protein_coding / is_pseudo=false
MSEEEKCHSTDSKKDVHDDGDKKSQKNELITEKDDDESDDDFLSDLLGISSAALPEPIKRVPSPCAKQTSKQDSESMLEKQKSPQSPKNVPQNLDSIPSGNETKSSTASSEELEALFTGTKKKRRKPFEVDEQEITEIHQDDLRKQPDGAEFIIRPTERYLGSGKLAVHTKLERSRHQITYLLTESQEKLPVLEEKWREGTRKRIEGRKRYGYI